MLDQVFVDSNILIYSVSNEPGRASEADAVLLEDADFYISTQVLNEFIAVTNKKKYIHFEKIVGKVNKFITAFTVKIVHQDTILSALRIQAAYMLSYWDALIVASALEANCSALITEDLQDGMVIDKVLTVRNPFR